MKILVVEDEKDLNAIVTKRLKREQYSVDSCYDGQEALLYLESTTYDVVLLDIMMPKLNGYEVLHMMRQRGIDTKVILLTARDSVDDKIKGLDLGADDYLVKPFEFGELLARIRVHVRRHYGHNHNVLRSGVVELDVSKKQVRVSGVLLSLTAKEYEVLRYLMQNSDHIVSRDQILNHVWDFEYDGLSNIVDVVIKNIRKKIAEYTEEPLIHTKRGLGYVVYGKE